VTATVTAANGLRSSVIFNWTLTTRIPDLRGRDQGDVQSVLTPAGLRLGDVSLVYDCTDPPGSVLGQTPPAGQAVPVRSSVSISVASLTDGRGHRCQLN
jgi:beta-lactam-binding protein with PASTA domain